MIRRSAGIIFALLLVPSSVIGQDIATCRSIESVLERLSCYDSIQIEAPKSADHEFRDDEPTIASEAIEIAVSEFSNWERKSESDPISDRQNVSFFAYPNERQLNQFGRRQTVFLQLRCSDNTTSAVLYFDNFQTQDSVRLAIRLDDQPATETTWLVASNRQAIGLWSGRTAIPFISSLKDVDRITMRVFLDDGAETYQFESERINEYASELSEACNWEF